MKNNEDAIRIAAYYNWQNAGCPNGQDEYFWAMAVEQLSNCSKANCNKTATVKKAATKTTSKAKSAACKNTASAKKSK